MSGMSNLHRRGHRGGTILPHRSIWRLRLPPSRLAAGVAIAAAFSGLLAAVQPWVAAAWGGELVWWLQQLGLPGRFAPPADAGELAVIAVPTVELQLGGTPVPMLLLHAALLALLWWGPARLPDVARPATFLLRFVALTHGAAVLYFVLWPASFPHSVQSHVASGLRQAWVLMLLTPWLHLGTYYMFPLYVWQRVLLTALTLAFLFVLAPLQYASHVAVLHLLGPLAMPVLHLLFGVMVPILGFVALYGWGMSWPGPAAADAPWPEAP